MTEIDVVIAAFDEELAHIAKDKTAQHYVQTIAVYQRAGLVVFCDAHGRPPETVRELFTCDLTPPHLRQNMFEHTLIEHPITREIHEACLDMSVRGFLRDTQSVVDGVNKEPPQETVLALRLTHAVYRAYDPFSLWVNSAKELSHRGFTSEQIKALRTDPGVRHACRLLLQPFHR